MILLENSEEFKIERVEKRTFYEKTYIRNNTHSTKYVQRSIRILESKQQQQQQDQE